MDRVLERTDDETAPVGGGSESDEKHWYSNRMSVVAMTVNCNRTMDVKK